MGLRFRKSISILPGVRMNMGLNGVSLSAGVPGFRKTINSNGRISTTVGLPGTGLYYTDSKKIGASSKRKRSPKYFPEPESTYIPESVTEPSFVEEKQDSFESNPQKVEKTEPEITPESLILSICKTCDDTIDWTEVLSNQTPPDDTYNADIWKYYHSVAKDVLRGDIDTYLKLVYEINPLDDLLRFANEFQFGTDNSHFIEVEYQANESVLSEYKDKLSNADYNLLLQDFICSISIRIARDMFALLPVRDVIVHSELNGITVLSVKYDRLSLNKLNFGYLDPSDTVCMFRNNMRFDNENGFYAVSRISSD